jgi:FKBP-type peptidyl-prolyl cis-trans isomerase FkpA
MKTFSFIVFTAFMLTSCSRYPGYKKLTPDIYFALRQFGDQKKKALTGDYVTVQIEYRTQKDSVFFTGIRKVKLNIPADNASVDHCFTKISQGDSASFIFSATKFFNNTLKRSLPGFISEGEMMKMNVRLMEIQSEKEFLVEKQLFLSWAAELSGYEKKVLQQFLKEEKPGIQAKPEGFYMITLRKGSSRKIIKGDHIWVNYEGKFLNGKYFDGTYRSREPVDFIYGNQFILIPGLEKALSYMSEGESAMIILPSDIAFGVMGDDFGIIPPYTSLVFTLEVVKIEKI